MTGDELYEHADELALEAVVGEYPEIPLSRYCGLSACYLRGGHGGPCEPGWYGGKCPATQPARAS